jgi:hypothetical protein
MSRGVSVITLATVKAAGSLAEATERDSDGERAQLCGAERNGETEPAQGA